MEEYDLRVIELYGIIKSNYGAISASYHYQTCLFELKPFMDSTFPNQEERIKKICTPCLNEKHMEKALLAIKEFKKIASHNVIENTKDDIKQLEALIDLYRSDILGKE